MLFGCKWPNGDLSFVVANSKIDAVIQLDDIDGAGEEDIFPIPDGTLLSINLKKIETPNKEGILFELEGFGEGMTEMLKSEGIELFSELEAAA